MRMGVSYHLPLLVAIALAGSPATARADLSYRLAVGAADVVSGAVFVTGVKLDGWRLRFWRQRYVMATVGLAGMSLAAPMIHAYEGGYGRAGISLGAHVALPMVGLVAALLPMRKPSFGVVLGCFMAGHLVASIIDVAIASKEDDPTSARVVSIGARF